MCKHVEKRAYVEISELFHGFYIEISELLMYLSKQVPKSSATRNHESIDQFANKHSKKIFKEFLFSQKDVAHVGPLLLKPLYMLPFLLEEI